MESEGAALISYRNMEMIFSQQGFVGKAAASANQGLAEVKAEIAIKAQDIYNVASAIGSQIGKLHEYVNMLEENIAALRRSMCLMI